MGNILPCSDGCYSWLRGYNQTVTKLRRLYRTKYRNTIFYQTCLTLVQNLHSMSQTGNLFLDEQSHRFKSSLIDSVNYQQSLLTSGPSSPNRQSDSPSLPTRLTSLTDVQKKQMISQLIRKSYILLDISDVFTEGEQGRHYQKQIKKKIFEGDDSLMTESFLDNRDAIVDSLRKFDTATIFKLQNYVQMAQQIKKSFNPQSQSHLSKFLLLLKSNLIQFNNSNQNATQLLSNTRLMIYILEDTIKIVFNIKFPVHRQPSGNDQHHHQNMHEEKQDHQTGIEFLNQTNVYTLSTCLVFQDVSFHQFYQRAISEIFHTQFHNYRKQTAMTDQAFVSKVMGQDKNLSNYFQPTIVGLFNKRKQQNPTFQKTIKMFNKLPKKLPPVLKLKLLAEVQKQFLRELKGLCKQKQAQSQTIYDRSTSQLLATWLINRDKTAGENNIASIIIAYAFVHSMYRLGAKGSIMISFVQVVERLLGWGIPTQ